MILLRPNSYTVVAIIFLFFAVVSAQERVDISPHSTAATLAKVEESLLSLKSQNGPIDIDLVRRLERQLKNALAAEPNTVFRKQIESNLDLVNEQLAFYDLLIARYYMRPGHGSLKGAVSRLKGIGQKYPSFKKMDEVFLLLSQAALQEEHPDEASIYLWRLVCNYPHSEYVASAFEQLNQIRSQIVGRLSYPFNPDSRQKLRTQSPESIKQLD